MLAFQVDRRPCAHVLAHCSAFRFGALMLAKAAQWMDQTFNQKVRAHHRHLEMVAADDAQKDNVPH